VRTDRPSPVDGLTSAERFWTHVDVDNTDSDRCWLWTASLQRGGYGQFWYRGVSSLAHRVAWAVSHGGELPDECVLHHCDVRACVRPSHLFLGTRVDNIADMCQKGRQRGAKGERNFCAKLTEEQVAEIRSLLPLFKCRPKRIRQLDVARQFGVTKAQIHLIWRGDNWRHVAAG
jgi:hypothetical protein